MLVLCPHNVYQFTLEDHTDFKKCILSSVSSPPSKRQINFFICFAQVWGHQGTEVGAVLPKVTLHKLPWQELLISCCEWSSRGKCGPASYVVLLSLHCLSDPLCDHQILLPSLTGKSNGERGWSKLTSGAADTEVLAKGGTWGVTGCRCPRFLRRYCKLWHIHLVAVFPQSWGHVQGNK